MPKLKVQLTGPNATSPGKPIAPEGWFETGMWAVAPVGAKSDDGIDITAYYFSNSDVDAGGNVTLHPPPDNWQAKPLGQTISSPFNYPASAVTVMVSGTPTPIVAPAVPPASPQPTVGLFAVPNASQGSPGAAS